MKDTNEMKRTEWQYKVDIVDTIINIDGLESELFLTLLDSSLMSESKPGSCCSNDG